MQRASAQVCALATIMSATALWATQPTPVPVTMDSRLVRNGASFLHVANLGRETYQMSFSPGPSATLTFKTVTVMLEPGAVADLNLGQLPFTDGAQVLEVTSLVSSDFKPAGENQTVTGPSLYEVLVADPISIRKSSYEAQFLSRRLAIRGDSSPSKIDFGGGYISTRGIGALAFESAALDPNTRFTPIDLPSPVEMAAMKPKEMPDFSASGAGNGPTSKLLGSEQDQSGGSNQTGPYGTIEGKIFLKVPASGGGIAVNPAWGWTVRGWQQIGSAWMLIGSTWAKGDGSWSMDFFIPPFPNTKVRVEYQVANRFMQVQDKDGNVYTWGDNWTLTGPLTDIGSRSINLTKTGDAPGIDVIYQGATALWRRFRADGMNALRDEPIQITFPNTSLDTCPHVDSAGNPTPWSCSQSSDGKIWLASKHAKAGVVQHEIAHSIHSYYWDGSMPSGSGGQHSLTACFNPGLALTEGFADFMPYWVQFDRDNPGPHEASLGYNIETPTLNLCAGASNEVHVSATFWDVYDNHTDGSPSDTWYFTHHGAAVGIFLNNPGHDSMAEYWNVYSNILGPQWLIPVMNTFTLNTMFH